MNVLEIYKRLPKTNCGQCTQKKCMPFAVALAKGEVSAGDCACINGPLREELDGLGGSGDWRESLIAELKKEVSTIDLTKVAEGLGAVVHDKAVSIRCLGRDFLVGPDGEVTAQGPLTPWMRILLLHYIRTQGDARLAGKWVAYAELRSGMVKASSFLRECEEPLRIFLDRMPQQTEQLLGRLGAVREHGSPAPGAWKFFALPKVPVMILYWPPDEEFPSKLKILFDATADRFLDVESLMFLLEGLVRHLEAVIGPDHAV